MKRQYALVAVVALTLPGLAFANDMTMPMKSPAATTPAEQANTAAMNKMMKTMAAKPTGNPDKDFVAMMLPHHVGAVDMAKIELQYGKDPQLIELARSIVAAQEKEIAEMTAWQAKNAK